MMPNMRSARMARWQILLLTISGSLLLLSGGAWILLSYFGRIEGEFGPEPNPWQPWLLRLHGLALIPALLGFGGLFVIHVPKGWRSKNQRNTGVALLAIIGVLILSGYLLYYVGDDSLRNWTSVTHWVIGLAMPAVFMGHYLQRRQSAKRDVRRFDVEIL